MEKGTLVIIATVLTIIGLVFLIDSLGITGGVISDSVGETTSSILGLIFIIAGIVLFMARKVKESNLVNRTGDNREVDLSDRFMRSIRGRDINRINAAIKKIGTRKGKEEILQMDPNLHSIRVAKGDRIIFYRMGEERVQADKYVSAHEYDRYKKARA